MWCVRSRTGGSGSSCDTSSTTRRCWRRGHLPAPRSLRKAPWNDSAPKPALASEGSAVRWLISSAIQLRVVVLGLCVVLLVLGYRAMRTAPLDVFPEFAPPKVEVQTEAPGLSTDEVESLV